MRRAAWWSGGAPQAPGARAVLGRGGSENRQGYDLRLHVEPRRGGVRTDGHVFCQLSLASQEARTRMKEHHFPSK